MTERKKTFEIKSKEAPTNQTKMCMSKKWERNTKKERSDNVNSQLNLDLSRSKFVATFFCVVCLFEWMKELDEKAEKNWCKINK